MKKDLAYSIDQVKDFLKQIDKVIFIEENSYSYKKAHIRLEEQEVKEACEHASIKALPRSYLYLSGDEGDIKEFYTTFMINHMTMGA